jgi:pilus assembly protein CpaF
MTEDELDLDRRRRRPIPGANGGAHPPPPPIGADPPPSQAVVKASLATAPTRSQRGLDASGADAGEDSRHALPPGIRTDRPQDRFPAWKQILSAVQAEFRRRGGEEGAHHAELAEEETFYNLVAQVVGKPQFGVQPVALPDLVGYLRRQMFGYMGLEQFLALDELEEVYFNRYDQGIYIQHGRKYRIWPPLFSSERELRDLIDRIADDNGYQIDLSHPVLDATLKDEQGQTFARINAVIEPISRNGTSFVVRRHRDIPFTADDYIATGSIPRAALAMLGTLIQQGARIVVSGGTATGKTSLLNVLGNAYIPKSERIIVLEDTPELQIYTDDAEYMLTLKDATRDAGAGERDITLRDLVRYCLRMRPDRIIVGEVRGKEAFDVLTAWNSGHEGSFLTIHANGASEALSKLVQLAVSAREFDREGVRDLVGRVVDVVLQLRRLRDGRRIVSEIVQVVHRDRLREEDERLLGELVDRRIARRAWEDVHLVTLWSWSEEEGVLVRQAAALDTIGL